MENGHVSQGEGKDPSSFLANIIGNAVTVKLNSGVVYKGVLDPGAGFSWASRAVLDEETLTLLPSSSSSSRAPFQESCNLSMAT